MKHIFDKIALAFLWAEDIANIEGIPSTFKSVEFEVHADDGVVTVTMTRNEDKLRLVIAAPDGKKEVMEKKISDVRQDGMQGMIQKGLAAKV
ncbi:hypothetical protein F4X90_22960 [Candidatus Poribacteria bacterium]|nr:hypothetical protein [Candidatus Poribacteria bacterium]